MKLIKESLQTQKIIKTSSTTSLKKFIAILKGEAFVLLLFIFLQPTWANSPFDFFFDANPFQEMGMLPQAAGADFDMQWSEQGTKKILTISPKEDSEVVPNIEIENDMLKVSGKMLKTETIEKDGIKSSSQFMSTFSFASQLPDDVDATKVKIEQDKNKIRLTFPKRKVSEKAAPKKEAKELQELKNLPGEYI
jgi:hypothetical protein